MGTGDNLVLMRTTEGKPLYYVRMDGVLYPPLHDYINHLKDVQNFACHSGDVWICGYPKSGNHWIWEVVQMIMKGKPEFDADVMERYLVDFEDLNSISLIQSRRILVSHLPCKHVPYTMFQKGIKIIYVLRNPKDIVVSAYNHLASVTDDFRQLMFSEFLALFVEGNVYYGDWYDHVLAWTEASRGNPNILIVKYEDMKKDLFREVKRVAGFLNRDLDEITARRIAKACTFANMKSKKKECHDKWREDALITSVYRKGEVGDWKNWFTEEENEEFDRRHRKRLEGSGVHVEFKLESENQ